MQTESSIRLLCLAALMTITSIIGLSHSNEPTKSREPTHPSTYNEVEHLPIPEAIEVLKGRTNRARQTIPQFPSWPENTPLITERGKWSSLGERACVEFMELLFPGHRFIKIRPSWLSNPLTGRRLELDGYCEELSLAIEYNGIQHYVWPNFTSMSQEEFLQQRARDQHKVETCRANRICLIRIPYTVPLERIPLAIYSKLLDAIPEK